MTKPSPSLPPGCIFRPACAKDTWAILKLILIAKLEPTQLRWTQFRVIEFEGRVVACGQLRHFPDAQELGSLVVAPKWRNRGLGSYLMENLIKEATQPAGALSVGELNSPRVAPLYLECMGWLTGFYTRFGFVSVSWQDLPKSLKVKFGLSKLATTLFRIPLSIMTYQPKDEG
ncbi:GNAT family N-acetyltransferase [Moorena producens JHB]|uniref:GNAT family N-acetyltransferase n=1 Tax=Moorena producens (strain JHB) TaxID=1454205 RepID=A0A1D9GAV0_MOOP1|nr:GNAT family N-acetyltransferase [Moorena producens]AOY84595.1 GNAT family N-acetyltransferase [Moorena producens JHB]